MKNNINLLALLLIFTKQVMLKTLILIVLLGLKIEIVMYILLMVLLNLMKTHLELLVHLKVSLLSKTPFKRQKSIKLLKIFNGLKIIFHLMINLKKIKHLVFQQALLKSSPWQEKPRHLYL